MEVGIDGLAARNGEAVAGGALKCSMARINRYARTVGKERVIASSDCGFAQGPFYRRVHPSIMWAKFEALAEGAKLASKELWG